MLLFPGGGSLMLKVVIWSVGNVGQCEGIEAAGRAHEGKRWVGIEGSQPDGSFVLEEFNNTDPYSSRAYGQEQYTHLYQVTWLHRYVDRMNSLILVFGHWSQTAEIFTLKSKPRQLALLAIFLNFPENIVGSSGSCLMSDVIK